MNRGAKLLLDVFLGIILNIVASYFLLPYIFGYKRKYVSINDIYVAVYVGLILTAVELVVIFIGVLIFSFQPE